MTRQLRRDARTKNASVITGVRLEAEVAQALRDAAVSFAPDDKGRGDVGQLARFYVRRGVGFSADAANQREAHGGFDNCVAGLAMESTLCKRLTEEADRLGITKAGAVRHFIRLGLGYSQDNSLEREAHFAELAASRKEAGLGGSTQFRGTR